jgi:hypothetical protein
MTRFLPLMRTAASLLRVELQYLEDLLYAAKTRLICKMTQDAYHHEHSDRIQQCTENLDDQNVDIWFGYGEKKTLTSGPIEECMESNARSSTYRSTALSSGRVDVEPSPKSISTCPAAWQIIIITKGGAPGPSKVSSHLPEKLHTSNLLHQKRGAEN